MPAQFDELLTTSGCEALTDDEMTDLRQEIIRDVITELMFGPQQSDRDLRRVSKVDRAGTTLRSLSCRLLDTADTRGHLAGFVDDLTDVEGALHYACLLHLVQEQEEAIWWWQYAAGAGNLTAAYCLSLLYLSRGELRDADHWMRQFLAPDSRSAFVPPPSWPHSLPESHLAHFKDAVRSSNAVEVDGIRLHHPDRRFLEQITDHLPPADVPHSDARPRQCPVLFPPRRRWW